MASLGPFSLLDVSATCDPDSGEVCLAVVNRSRSEGLPTSISLGGRASDVHASVVNGPDVGSQNSFEAPDSVSVREETLHANGATLEYTFEPHSVTLLRYGSQK